MKIGVLSDIHLKSDSGSLQKIINAHLSDVDMFFLCGDLTTMRIYDLFSHKRVEAVAGNMDDYELKSTLPIKRVVEIHGHKFGLIHGYGSPHQIEERITTEFDDVNCIVYGHTHSAVNKKVNNIMYFNPGSPTDKMFAEYNSVGILHVTDYTIEGEIIKI